MDADPMTLFGMAMAAVLLAWLGWRRRGGISGVWHGSSDGDWGDDGGGGDGGGGGD